MLVSIGLVFPSESLAKNLNVVVEETGITSGLVPFVLDVVGVEPSVV